ncbi:MAG: ion transporter [Hyphococcus sp.]|nr:MAG: ion transporter [Marinicaulis sp.]
MAHEEPTAGDIASTATSTEGDGDNQAPVDDNSDSLMGRLRSMIGLSSNDQDLAEAIDNGDTQAIENMSASRREMIERVVAFDEKRVVDVMAPRADIAAVDVETPLDALIQLFAEAGHSRMPVYRGDLDDPVGMVHIKDVVGLIADGVPKASDEDPVLKRLRREILYAPPSMLITDLLLRMQATRIHMALVIDEYGGTDGLVTIEDLVEEIVGDINDEHDADDTPVIVTNANNGWDVDARVELEEFTEETGVNLHAEDEEIDTVGGYVVSLAGRVPQRGEVISSGHGLDVEVIEADARKVRRLRIRPASGKTPPAIVARTGEAAE